MMTTAEKRRWAVDLTHNYTGTRYEDKANAHANRIVAEADLDDLIAGREPTTADKAEIVQTVPVAGNIYIQGGRRIKIDYPYNAEIIDYAESRGIYVGWEWQSDPTAEFETGKLSRMYIGSKERGPEAQYNAYDNTWYNLVGKGNHGKKYACGGTWRGKKCIGTEVPQILKKLEEIIMEHKKIEIAKKKLEVAKLRVKAAHQQEHANAYYQQASRPAYPGQDIICLDKGNVVNAIAVQTLAAADLLEAEAT